MPRSSRRYYNAQGRYTGRSEPVNHEGSRAIGGCLLVVPIVLFVLFEIVVAIDFFIGLIGEFANWTARYSQHPFPFNLMAWNIYFLFMSPYWLLKGIASFFCEPGLTRYANLNVLLAALTIIASISLVIFYFRRLILHDRDKTALLILGAISPLTFSISFILLALLLNLTVDFFHWVFA